MRFSSVLVTGGAGFIGRHILSRLIQDGVKVGVLDNFAQGQIGHMKGEKDFHIHKGDILDSELVASIVDGYEAVLHQAAIVGINNSFSGPLSIRQTNVDGTANLLRASANANVESFVFASSAAVYGKASSFPLSEETVTNPSSIYGSSKLLGEQDCQKCAAEFGLRTVCLRYFNVYGPGQRPGLHRGVVANFTEKLLKGESPVVYGDGKQTRDFVHVSDVVEANFLALDSQVPPGSVFNVCTGKPTSINELVVKLCDAMGRTVVEPTYVPARSGDIRHSHGDFGKAQKFLGYQPRVGLEQGLRDLVGEIRLAEPVAVRP